MVLRSWGPALAAVSLLAPATVLAQTDTLPRPLSPKETGCRSPGGGTDSAYTADEVDEPVRPRRLSIEGMPFRTGEVLTGRTVFRFIVDEAGRIDRCNIVLLEESAPSWTAAVLKELRYARYEPARRGDQPVRQWVHQLFTYHSDGRLQKRR